MRAPEDDPLFDPEDDRIEYVDRWTSEDEIELDVWADLWPESVDPDDD